MKTLGQLLSQLSGARVVGQPDVAITRVHTDTRSLQPGDLFVALKGERFDAHDFLPQAAAQGAVAAIAHSGLAEAGLPGVEVPDTRRALGELALAVAPAVPSAADRRDRQQRQDHGHADDRVHPARRRGRCGPRHAGRD